MGFLQQDSFGLWGRFVTIQFDALAFEPSRGAGRQEKHLLWLRGPQRCRSLALSKPGGSFDQGLCSHWSLCLTSSCYCCSSREPCLIAQWRIVVHFYSDALSSSFLPSPTHLCLCVSLTGCVMATELVHPSDLWGFLSVHCDEGGKKREGLGIIRTLVTCFECSLY